MTNATPNKYQPLDEETRAAVDTATAAFHLNRRPQTLRSWACFENGPVRPIRINGRLAWPVSELRRVLGCGPCGKPSHRTSEQRDESAAGSQEEQA